MKCSHCGSENPAGVRFCSECGQGLESDGEGSGELSKPVPPLPPDTSVEWRAGVGTRLAAGLLDGMIAGGLAVVLTLLDTVFGYGSGYFDWMGPAAIAAYFFLEVIFGYTPGKRILNLMVLSSDGQPPMPRMLARRWLIKIGMPAFFVLVAIGGRMAGQQGFAMVVAAPAVLILLSGVPILGRNRQAGWDLAAGTGVGAVRLAGSLGMDLKGLGERLKGAARGVWRAAVGQAGIGSGETGKITWKGVLNLPVRLAKARFSTFVKWSIAGAVIHFLAVSFSGGFEDVARFPLCLILPTKASPFFPIALGVWMAVPAIVRQLMLSEEPVGPAMARAGARVAMWIPWAGGIVYLLFTGEWLMADDMGVDEWARGSVQGTGPMVVQSGVTGSAAGVGASLGGGPIYGTGTKDDPYRDYPDVDNPPYGRTESDGESGDEDSESPDEPDTTGDLEEEDAEGGWEVEDDEGNVRVFRTKEEAEDYYEGLIRKERVRQTEGDYRNAVEQIGFLQSVRNGLVKAGKDTSEQDREIARWQRERNRLRGEVNRLGGDTDYTARKRSDYSFGQHDDLLRRQKEKSDLLRSVHRTAKATRALADKDIIRYGDGQTTNILEKLDQWSESIVSGNGKPPTPEELRRLQGILRKEIGAEKARVEARNTNWVKEGAQATSREIVTGTNSNGETSYKAMVLRGLVGAATGGKSEYVYEVGEKIYIVHDEVQKGKTGLEAFRIAAERVVTDEITGRVVETGISAGGKVGSAGYEKFVKGTSVDTALTKGSKKVGDFLNRDVRDVMRRRPDIPEAPVSRVDLDRPRTDPETVAKRTEAFNEGRRAGKKKVDRLKEALENQRRNPDSPAARRELDAAVDAVQKDKHAMQTMNRSGQDPASRQVREGFNHNLECSYDQAHAATRQRLADEYGVPIEDIEVVKVTNKPGVGGEIEAAEPRGLAKKPDPKFETHPDDYPLGQRPEVPEKEITGAKSSYDQDITYRKKQENVFDPRTGEVKSGKVDIPKAETQRVYEQEFYKARHDGELPTVKNADGSVKLDANGKPEIDMKEVHNYNKVEMDQACTDRLDAEAYGNGDRDLQTAVKGEYKGRDFDDVEGVGKTMEHKQNEWQKDAGEARQKAGELHEKAEELTKAGDSAGAKQATEQAKQLEARAEGLTEEGYRQTTKQYGNQLESRVDAANQQEFFKHQNNGDLPMKQNPNTGQMEVDMNQVRQHQQDFYQQQNGELPTLKNPDGSVKLNEEGIPEVDMKKVTEFTTERGKASGMRTAEIPPKLDEAVGIMKKTGEPGFSPAEVEAKLEAIGYTPEKVSQQMSSNLESLQKFKGASGPGVSVAGSGVPDAPAGFDFKGAAKGAVEGVKRPAGRTILGSDSNDS